MHAAMRTRGSCGILTNVSTDDCKHLAAECHRNEAELERLRDLPVSDVDPTARKGELERRQDEIEWELGRLRYRQRRQTGAYFQNVDAIHLNCQRPLEIANQASPIGLP
ncbi:MAG: hypothetical protein AMXMBFR58_28250 [Phycisphaerae bacterium]